MTKVTVAIELDNEGFDKAYGPGSEWWVKTYEGSDPDYVAERIREYKSLEGEALEDAIVEILSEGFYDWQKNGLLKLTIDHRGICKSCGRVNGREHRSWCETVAGPEVTV